MKKLLTLIMSIMLISALLLVGCGKEPENQEPQKPVTTEKPEIVLEEEQTEYTVPFTDLFYIPLANCLSKADGQPLPITYTVTGPNGENVEVVDAKFAPVALGEHKIAYNATDIDADSKKADEVIVKVTFTALEKPVLTLSTEDREFTDNLSDNYELPFASAKSVMNPERDLEIVITAVDSEGNEVAVENGVLKATKEDTYTVTYTAYELAPLNTASDSIVIKVTLEVKPPVFAETEDAVKSYTNEVEFAIPDFDDVMTIDHPFYHWTSADFNIAKKATFTKYGSEEAVEIVDMDTAKKYSTGTINVEYTLTLKTDETKVFTQNFEIKVENLLFGLLLDRANSVNSKKEIIVDPALSDKEIIKISALASWSGMMVLGQENDLLGALNASEDNVLVLNCYNPSDYAARYFVSCYATEGDYAGGLSGKYIVDSKEYFDIVVTKSAFGGLVSKVDINIQKDDVGGTYPSDSVSILDYKIVNKNEYRTAVWANDDMPMDLKVYTDLTYDEVSVPMSAYNENGVQGLLFDNSANGDYVDIDLLSKPATNKVITDKFADVRKENKYNSYLSMNITNVGEAAATVYTYKGHGGNQPERADGYMYSRAIGAGETKNILFAVSQTDGYDLNAIMDYLRLAVSGNAKIVMSDVNIYNYPTCNKTPLTKLAITEIAEKHTEEALKALPDTQWTVPAFETMYNVNFPVTASTKVLYKDALEAAGEEVTADPITLKAGYYEVIYTVTETATGDVVTKSFTLTVSNPFASMEKPGNEALKRTFKGKNYAIPSYDTLFTTEAAHTATVKSVEYKNAESAWTAISVADNAFDVVYSEYRITYNVKETNGKGDLDASFILRSDVVDPASFSCGGGTLTPAEDGNSVIFTGVSWNAMYYNNKEVIDTFNVADKDSFLYVKGKNIGEGTINLLFAWRQVNIGDQNNMQFRLSPAAGEDFTIMVSSEWVDITAESSLCIDLANFDGTAKIQIFEYGVVKAKDANDMKAYTFTAEKAADVATASDMTVEYVDNSYRITASGDKIWNLTQDTEYKASFDKIKNMQETVFAVDVTNEKDTDESIWFAAGQGGNAILYGPMREQRIPANSTRTLYITNSMLMNEPANKSVDTVWINNDSRSFIFSNIRIVDFSAII